jgi:hypothetical protein
MALLVKLLYPMEVVQRLLGVRLGLQKDKALFLR